MTIRAGVAGRPITHSLSPAIHGAWIGALGLDATYDAFEPADEEAFAGLVDRVRRGELAGLNVTAPYKTQALALADAASETARRAGTGNLLVHRTGRVEADSTDGAGVLAALAEQAADLDLTDGPALILGAGGAARAAAAALLDAGSPAVIVWNRTAERARGLVADLGERVRTGGSADEAVLIVNALSNGERHDFALTGHARAALDMTYRPLETDFLRAAARAGVVPVDGLAMLIGQARPSFRALFGHPEPDIDVRAVALAAMGEKA